VSFYPLHLLLATLPWTPLLVAAAISIYRDPRRRADPRLQFLQIWIAAVVVVFSFAAFKLRHYLLPALRAAAMVASELTAPWPRDRSEGLETLVHPGQRIGCSRRMPHVSNSGRAMRWGA